MPLQESPQKFSSIQAWHMAKPHWRQVQQKGTDARQQWQAVRAARFRRRRVLRGGDAVMVPFL